MEQPQTVPDQESWEGAFGQCGLVKTPILPRLAFRKSIPGTSSLLGGERDISIRPKFPEVYRSFLLHDHGASPICAELLCVLGEE